jgi:tetratricopeptide (TPR) repeat protein
VTREIANEIQLALSPVAEARLVATAEVHPEAHEAYLQGRFYSGKLTAADLEIAIDYYNLAMEKDSTYAAPYAGLSWAWVARQQMGQVSPSEATPIAVAAAQRALELDSLLPEGHHALATALGWAGWDWQVSEHGLRRAIELNPSYGDARADFSHLLLVLKRFEESEAQIDTALASDPFNVKFQAFRGVVYMNTLQREKGFEEFDKVMRAVPNHPVARSVLGDVYHELGQYDEAMNHIAAMYAAEGIEDFATALRRDYEEFGYRPAMTSAAERLEAMAEVAFVPPIMIASLHAYAGDVERTLAWLERGFAGREPNLPYIGVTPFFDFVRSEPRFQALLVGMKLPWALEGSGGDPGPTG